MKRLGALLLAAGVAIFAWGCKSAEEETPVESHGAATSTSGSPTTTSTPGNFKEGVDSGRNPDGSDEAR